MKISIALAAWRGTAHLTQQLDSLAAQTRLPDEVIAVDDASDDDTPQMLELYAKSAPFEMRVLRNPVNLGYAGNFARALETTTGDVVFLCDQDDFWFREKLATMEAWARAEPGSQIFVCDAELTDADLVPCGRTKRGQIAAAGLPRTAFVMGCCLAIRRPFLELMLPFPDNVRAHDFWLMELADRLQLTRRYDTVLQYYRQHGANTSDFFVNTTREFGTAMRTDRYLRALIARLRSDGGLLRERGDLALQDRRLKEKREEFTLLAGAGRVKAACTILAERLALLDARAGTRSLNLLARPGAVLRLWRGGAYGQSGGMAGALRDITAWRTR